MEKDLPKMLLAGVIVILITASIVVGVYFNGSLAQKGTLIVKLTDAPVDLSHLNITISSISVQKVDQNGEVWENLSFVDGVREVYVDLLALHNVTKDLSVTQITPGNYTKLRMAVASANATFSDGTTANLTVPPGHIEVIVNFEIKSGATTTVILDMQVDWVAISQSGNLRPVLKATVSN